MIYSHDMHRDADTGLYPPSVLVLTTLTNDTEGYQFSSWVDQVPADDRPTFKQLQREWGRCTSRVYCDTPTGAEPIGYFFVSRQEYEDWRGHGDRYYLRGAWITFMDLPALDFLPYTVREAQQAMELIGAT